MLRHATCYDCGFGSGFFVPSLADCGGPFQGRSVGCWKTSLPAFFNLKVRSQSFLGILFCALSLSP